MIETETTTSTKVATEEYVQARVAEMEGKLERAVREITSEIRSDSRDSQDKLERAMREITGEMRADRQENQRRFDQLNAETQRRFDTQVHWVIAIGIALILAALIRPSLG